MTKPELYKKIEITNAVNRSTQQLSEGELTSVNDTINKFIDFFKQKHL